MYAGRAGDVSLASRERSGDENSVEGITSEASEALRLREEEEEGGNSTAAVVRELEGLVLDPWLAEGGFNFVVEVEAVAIGGVVDLEGLICVASFVVVDVEVLDGGAGGAVAS